MEAPVLFNYIDGAELAPKTDMTGYANGMANLGKYLGGAITQIGNKIKQANQQQTPEEQAQAYALSQQALQMLQPQQQQNQGLNSFNDLMQQVVPQQNSNN